MAPRSLRGAPVRPGPGDPEVPASSAVRGLLGAVDVVQYAVVVGLLVVAAVVLVRSVVDFLAHPAGFPDSVVTGLDGVLVVIIILDILRTVLTHFEGNGLPVRPFLVIGILSAVRDILSASAHLTLQSQLSPREFNQAVTELAVAVGVVTLLLAGLLLLRLAESRRAGSADPG